MHFHYRVEKLPYVTKDPYLMGTFMTSIVELFHTPHLKWVTFHEFFSEN